MFDQLFNCHEALTRHRSAPLLDARLRFFQYCQERGSPRGTLRRIARELLVVIDQLNLQAAGPVRPEDVEAAGRREEVHSLDVVEGYLRKMVHVATGLYDRRHEDVGE